MLPDVAIATSSSAISTAMNSTPVIISSEHSMRATGCTGMMSLMPVAVRVTKLAIL